MRLAAVLAVAAAFSIALPLPAEAADRSTNKPPAQHRAKPVHPPKQQVARPPSQRQTPAAAKAKGDRSINEPRPPR